MKKILFVILTLGLFLIAGCSGNEGVVRMSLYDFIGDWYMTGEFDLDLEGREFLEEVDTVLHVQEGSVYDDLGYTYTATLMRESLILERDAMFKDYDDYCGAFEGGGSITFIFPTINPFFKQAYDGTVSGETAAYTQRCNYKPLVIAGTFYLQKAE